MPPPPPPAADMSTKARPRYFRNDMEPSKRDAHKQLVASLTRLVTTFPPDKVPPGGGIYYGPISIAYLFFILHPMYPELKIEEMELSGWAAVYLKEAEKNMKSYPGPSVGMCGVKDDIMAILALGAASSKDSDMVNELCKYADITTDPEAECEWLNGRAGYLYLLRMVRATFINDQRTLDQIEDTADEVIESIMELPRPWKWHGKAYLGAVHGAIGIITQIVLTDPSWSTKLEADLGALLSYQFDGGNWPSSIPAGKDRLVQICHGAPGIVASLESIREHFPKLRERIEGAIRKGRECIRERGLLTKEPCLCHGISGNALALEDADFEHFLTFTTGHEMKSMEKDGMMEKSDDPSSLWCGEAGRAWAWAVADKGLERRLLGYNDI
ncbi:hypothetical protein K402DRAFT_390716 [Aulographum hederae CBS 113979]|uniref:Lanthionine synthetase C-like protein n=1 Tax=Aulographum hederae CBS 113979 TaxID=1176131 RepID=A0A6G1H9A9_9PEZI|nr:hypothetical protein K402DRAFT_390716 [Aulographum hederae CBS 113979]